MEAGLWDLEIHTVGEGGPSEISGVQGDYMEYVLCRACEKQENRLLASRHVSLPFGHCAEKAST